MSKINKQKIEEILADLVSPEAGKISALQINGRGEVVFMIEVDPQRGPELEPLRQEAEKMVSAQKGVSRATAILTAEHSPTPEQQNMRQKTPDPHGMQKNPRLENLPVKNIIAVASGKGGVGKSTVAVNLAWSLSRQGYSTGILDADIYGPSVPKMTGTEGKKPAFNEKQKIIPLQAHGLKIMSIGFLLKNKEALIWRGPMVQTALYQMLRDVAWGTPDEPLDILVVDMPPGTGDAQLTLAQKVPVSGAVIVSTPQDIALIDARKAVEMFRKVDVPILGLIENMSTYICPKCGHEEPIFGQDAVGQESKNLDVPYLGAIPLSREIRMKSDSGDMTGLEEKLLGEVVGRLEI